MASKVLLLSKCIQCNTLPSRQINCWVAAITRTHRRIYLRKYPTLLQQPDGSTINIKYHEPIGVITLPLNLNELSEAQRKARLEKRFPKVVKEIQEVDKDIEDVYYDETRYLKQ